MKKAGHTKTLVAICIKSKTYNGPNFNTETNDFRQWEEDLRTTVICEKNYGKSIVKLGPS